MKELYSIMRDLLEVEYNQKSLLYLMETLIAADSGEEQESENLAVNGARYYLTVLQEDLGTVRNRLETSLAQEAGKK